MQFEKKKNKMPIRARTDIGKLSQTMNGSSNPDGKYISFKTKIKFCNRLPIDSADCNKNDELVKEKLTFCKDIKHKLCIHKKKKTFIPSTPHNTGQYIIYNHNYQRRRKTVLKTELDDLYSIMMDGVANIEEICTPGGSMKGLLNSKIIQMFPYESEYMSNYSTQTGEEDNEDNNFQLSRKNSIQNAIFNIDDVNSTESDEIEQKTVIENKSIFIYKADKIITKIQTNIEPS